MGREDMFMDIYYSSDDAIGFVEEPLYKPLFFDITNVKRFLSCAGRYDPSLPEEQELSRETMKMLWKSNHDVVDMYRVILETSIGEYNRLDSACTWKTFFNVHQMNTRI